MNAKKVIVLRSFDNGKQTLGTLSVTDPIHGIEMVGRTLELPDKANQNNVSCILAGKYLCKYTKSVSFSQMKGAPVYTYEITSVPGRAGVRIHSANYYTQLRGCISLGDAHKDINADGELDSIHSGDTVTAFEKLLNYEDFELTILDATK
jgi:hypothetical protein